MSLDENDYLTYQLYIASKTRRIRNARLRGWILAPVMFLGLAYLFFESSNVVLGYYFLVLSGISVVLYPFYSRWRYKSHYKKFIAENYKNRFGEPCTIEINEDFITTKDRTGEAKINAEEVEVINEIKDFYFVKMKSGASLIISKIKTDPHELESLVEKLKDLRDKRGIQHNIELDWRWR
jgi:hypothetical protein